MENCCALSTEEVVWGLLRAGFSITQRASSLTVMERGRAVIAIPTVATLPPEALRIIIRDAGIDEASFFEFVGEAPTERAAVVD